MSNASDYLKWRGDLDFSQAPFNDVDNLILAQIAYVDFTDIVPAPEVSRLLQLRKRQTHFLIPMMRRRLRNANLS
ncbi:MAG: hypothetical protein ACLS9K_11905 [Lachnospira eligens]